MLPAEEESLDPPVLNMKEVVHETSPVTRGNMELFLSSIATAVSDRNQSVAFPESGGILKKMFVNEGDPVKKGAPIAELDSGDLPIRLKLQELTVEQRKIRYQDAVKQNSDKDTVRLAQIDLEAEQLQLDALKKAYSKALLFAPADGVVTYVNDLKPGEAVEANQSMAVISNPNRINLVYDATDATKIAAVKKGTEVDVTLDKQALHGTVIQTPSTAPKSEDPKVTSRNAKSLVIALDEPNPGLKIGAYADIKLFIEKRDNVLIVPREGLKSMFGRNYVEIIENNRVKQVDVDTGLRTGSQVEVLKGLEEGQKVVIDN